MLSLIVAMAENRVIGRDGQLPWRLSSDLRRFKQLTMGHHIVMGRRTYESIGRPLPGRRMVVMSRDAAYRPPGVLVASSLQDALLQASGDPEVFVIGGEQIYRLALPHANRIYLTCVEGTIDDGDTYFPPLDQNEWLLKSEEHTSAGNGNDRAFTLRILDRASRSL